MRAFRVLCAVLALCLLSGCTVQLGTAVTPNNSGGSSGSGSGSGPDVDIRTNAEAKVGDCIGEADAETGTGTQAWVVNCANHNAVERVVSLVPHSGSDACLRDDYTGFDYQENRPSLCLMLYGNPGDCYAGFVKRTARSPRVPCTDPRAKLRLAAVLPGRGPCPAAPGDAAATSLFYGAVPGAGDRTYCLASPRGR